MASFPRRRSPSVLLRFCEVSRKNACIEEIVATGSINIRLLRLKFLPPNQKPTAVKQDSLRRQTSGSGIGTLGISTAGYIYVCHSFAINSTVDGPLCRGTDDGDCLGELRRCCSHYSLFVSANGASFLSLLFGMAEETGKVRVHHYRTNRTSLIDYNPVAVCVNHSTIIAIV